MLEGRSAHCVWLVLLISLLGVVRATKYVVYPLYMGEGCNDMPCNEDYTCTHTCYLHGLECATENFDCYSEAVKYCGGKDLTLFIRGDCDTDLCDVDCDLGIYYSSMEHIQVALCDSGLAPLCPRLYPSSLCQCKLPDAVQDLYKENVTLKISLNYKFVGLIAFGVMVLGAIAMKVYNKCIDDSDDTTLSESEIEFLALEGNNSTSQPFGDSSTDVLLKKKKKSHKSSKPLKHNRKKRNEEI